MKNTIPKQTSEKKAYPLYDVTASYKWYDLRTFLKWFGKKTKDSQNILVNMELNNGFHISFLVPEKDATFVWEHKLYIMDLDLKYYSISSKYFCLDYHEGVSLPIRRKIDVNAINKIVDMADYECPTALNPSNLKLFQESSIIEQIILGHKLSKELALIRVLLFIILVILIIFFLLFCFKAGVFQSMPTLFKFGAK